MSEKRYHSEWHGQPVTCKLRFLILKYTWYVLIAILVGAFVCLLPFLAAILAEL